MFIGELSAKDIPRKILKNCSSRVCRPRNQICAKNNPLKIVRPYNSSRLACYTGVIVDMS